MKKIIIIVTLLVALQLLAGDVNWQNCYTATVEQLQMLYQSAGVIYGVGYKYFVKSDNGSDFQNIMVADCDSLHLASAYMVSSTVGYCGGTIYDVWDPYAPMLPVLYKTTDGGQSWIRTGQFEQQSAQYFFQTIQFVSDSEGYAIVSPATGFELTIYRTTNSGQSWTPVYIHGLPSCSDFKAGLMVVGQYGPEGVLVSANGLSWQFHQAESNYTPSGILSNGSRIILALFPHLWYSDDLGNEWHISDQSQLGDDWISTGCRTHCVFSAQGNNIYAITGTWYSGMEHPGIVRSLNNGTSWQWIVQPADMPDQSGQVYGICYWGEYLYIAHNGHIYRTYVGPPVVNDDPTIPVPDIDITCCPNPFRGSTNITIKQIDNSLTTIAVYNLRGQLVQTVVNNQKLSPGEHSFTWDGKNDDGQPVAAGIYFFKMTSGKYSTTRKIVLMK